jgi:hypothetical protein
MNTRNSKKMKLALITLAIAFGSLRGNAQTDAPYTVLATAQIMGSGRIDYVTADIPHVAGVVSAAPRGALGSCQGRDRLGTTQDNN